MTAEPAAQERHFVRAVERAFRVVRAFGPDTPSMTLSEVAARTDLDRATARRLLLTLVDLGYARRTGRDRFELTPRVLELGYAYLSGLSLVDVALPHLQAMSYELHETASLTELDGTDVVYLALARSARLSGLRITVGTRYEAWATSMGRVLLAGLPDDELDAFLASVTVQRRTDHTVRDVEALRDAVVAARTQGWALVERELDDGLRGVAAPVRNRAGRVIAAVNVSTHVGVATRDELTDRHLPRLLRAAADIERDLAASDL
ncbi:IclR family transcriptional regulator domain-containing protein [Pseudonocardia spirodelae]|uniref:IclR family transcriptional regulator C-terminal domain-containing protein n=1 Tax=Pseudonocardia spirodelae TaxID=3133431 RepID=A0ABU8TA67_9PSEU